MVDLLFVFESFKIVSKKDIMRYRKKDLLNRDKIYNVLKEKTKMGYFRVQWRLTNFYPCLKPVSV